MTAQHAAPRRNRLWLAVVAAAAIIGGTGVAGIANATEDPPFHGQPCTVEGTKASDSEGRDLVCTDKEGSLEWKLVTSTEPPTPTPTATEPTEEPTPTPTDEPTDEPTDPGGDDGGDAPVPTPVKTEHAVTG